MKGYEIGDSVTITASSEKGEVIGVADFKSSEKQCLVRYRSADGRAVEAWWGVSALS